MKFSLSIPDFLMLALALQGFILSGVLLYSSKKIKSNRWISLLIFCISVEAIMPIAQLLIAKIPSLSYLLFPTNLALGPLIYFYTRSLLFGDSELPRKKYLYFAPILMGLKHQTIFMLYISGILSIPFVMDFYFRPETQGLLFNFSNKFILLSILSMVIYMVISYRLIANNADKETLPYKIADVLWLKKLLKFLFVLLVLWIVAIISKTFFNTSWEHYILFVPAIVFIHWLGFKAYLRQATMALADIEVYNKPAAKVYFSDDEIAEYSSRIDQLMAKDKLYLDPLLKLEDVATKLILPEKLVSNLVNQHIGKNFNDFINSYRVEEALKKLADPMLSHFTIAALAFDCGFNSLATFQRCFKQFTGLTPSQYQNTLKLTIAPDK